MGMDESHEVTCYETQGGFLVRAGPEVGISNASKIFCSLRKYIFGLSCYETQVSSVLIAA